jgi:hypothetical protein
LGLNLTYNHRWFVTALTSAFTVVDIAVLYSKEDLQNERPNPCGYQWRNTPEVENISAYDGIISLLVVGDIYNPMLGTIDFGSSLNIIVRVKLL